MLRFLLKIAGIPRPMKATPVNRQEPCRACGTTTGWHLGGLEYWDLRLASLVKCSVCSLIQLDPMITGAALETGCRAFFYLELSSTPEKEQERNLIRNFRRGILFGHHLKRLGAQPAKILEFGAGSGYFAAGVAEIFPECRVTVVDIVDEVLENNRQVHGFEAYRGSPENVAALTGKKFDLIIARDLIEHVADIGLVIRNISGLLNHDGLFHFITPNGHEDVWKHYLRSQAGGTSELLINHLNYFDGNGLEELLAGNGLEMVEYYSYTLKTTLRGNGWSMKNKLAAPASKRLAAEGFIREHEVRGKVFTFDKVKVLDAWYLKKGREKIRFLVCWYQHRRLIRVSPKLNIGHEFSGLFKKTN
jgi:SAM-dependent methyltransferase